jgi:DNA-binding response OmpR family regulator
MIQMNDQNKAFMPAGLQGAPKASKKLGLPIDRGEVILAIEDEEILREFLQMILEENGYRVMLAADGTEGVRTFFEHINEINLVLLDMGLPGISGEEVLSKIVSKNPNAKVITVSGSVDPDVQANALQTGAADYLPKPYLTAELLLKVGRVLHEGVRLNR